MVIQQEKYLFFINWNLLRRFEAARLSSRKDLILNGVERDSINSWQK
jgi:hypothetical protein